jgi:hypothetical protein
MVISPAVFPALGPIKIEREKTAKEPLFSGRLLWVRE